MDVRHLTFLLLFYLASGFFISMGVLRASEVGRRYYLYHGLGAAVLALGSWLVLGNHEVIPYVEKGLLWSVVFYTGYALTAGGRWWLSTPFYIFGLFSSLYVIIADLVPTVAHASPASPDFSLFFSNALLSALLLGFTMAAMIVGHWYLVQPKLSIAELRRTTLIFIGLLFVRFAFGSYGLWTLTSGKGEMEIYRYLLGGYPGLFIVMRWFWGLVGPLVLCYFIWSTVRIRSTQSATGILYVAVVCVLAGEILSQYLALFHGIVM
ncbi:MAG: hypothetical protein H6617_06470 [Bdellovibrionaceae bacterium]|nr:hypothetical protein [Bdellovibrionales bacterium]MCB9254309.1 hypothetical protein [Pseudobdellovibrionaceae bacterium]